jgi:hypothetical protein
MLPAHSASVAVILTSQIKPSQIFLHTVSTRVYQALLDRGLLRTGVRIAVSRGAQALLLQYCYETAKLGAEGPMDSGYAIDFIGGPCRTRTYNQRIKSPLLYQLS